MDKEIIKELGMLKLEIRVNNNRIQNVKELLDFHLQEHARLRLANYGLIVGSALTLLTAIVVPFVT